MNPTQVAADYTSGEGFDCCIMEDGSANVFHPNGTARVSPDGQVHSESNPRLKAVLEKKIAIARANERQLQEDPSGRCTIKFSSLYRKMPGQILSGGSRDAKLLAVLKVKRPQLSTRYKNQQKRDKIDEQVRGIRTAINILIEKEKELLAESEKLKPARQLAARGGA
jgi:hypothetical protein